MSENRIALVTGANKGIGREVARQLAVRGHVVYAGARDAERGRRAAAELAAAGDVRHLLLDVTDDASVTAAAERLEAEAGRLDVLVNNAGINLGSLTYMSDPSHRVREARLLAYNSSKAALNAITLLYAGELREAGIVVNAVTPGYVATDLNGHRGQLTVEEGAQAPVRAATLPADGPTGAFLSVDGPVPW